MFLLYTFINFQIWIFQSVMALMRSVDEQRFAVKCLIFQRKIS